MRPLERAVVTSKLQHLRELVERLLHLCVEAASDLLEHLLVQGSAIRPQTYADTFLQAGQHNWISMDLALRLVPAAGLRNRLVHDYEAIDPRRVHAAMGIALADLDALITALTGKVAI